MDVEISARHGSAVGVLDHEWERDPLIRALCLRYHGTRCHICHTDLAQRYGHLGASSTQVHLIHPRAFVDVSRVPDPVEDLIPVCPSCHVMLHLGRTDPMPVEDLRRWMTRARVLQHDGLR